MTHRRYSSIPTPGWSCRHCGAHSGPKPTRKIKIEALLPKIRDYILLSTSIFYTKEALSVHFNVQESLIEQCLHTLNLEGLVSQATHEAPHDSTRDYLAGGPDSAWQGNRYYVTEKTQQLREKK